MTKTCRILCSTRNML